MRPTIFRRNVLSDKMLILASAKPGNVNELWEMDSIVMSNEAGIFWRALSGGGALYARAVMDSNDDFVIGNYQPGGIVKWVFFTDASKSLYLTWEEHGTDELPMLRHSEDWFINSGGDLGLEADDDVTIEAGTNVSIEANGVSRYTYVPLTTSLTSATWKMAAGNKTSSDNGIIDLSSVFSVPAGVKSVDVRVTVQSSTPGDYLLLGPTSSQQDQIVCRAQVNGVPNDAAGTVNCDSNGDIYVTISGTITTIIEIWGYYI